MYALILAATVAAPAAPVDARVSARAAFTLAQAAKEVEVERSQATNKPCPNGGGANCNCGCREGGACTCAKSPTISQRSFTPSSLEGRRLERSTFVPSGVEVPMSVQAPVVIEYREPSPPPGTVIWSSPVQSWTSPAAVLRSSRRSTTYRMVEPQTFTAPATMPSSSANCAG